MPLSINTNIASLTAQRAMYNSNSALETSYERLSTGKRINSASDDAAGLAIGKDLESRVSGLNQAIRNVNDGISMVQIAEGTLDEVTSILQRMRDLSVQAANGSLSSTEQGYLDTEQSRLATTLGSVLDQAQFNEKDLVSDTAQTTVTIQSGADANETTAITFKALTETRLGVSAGEINLAGTASTKEQVTVAGVVVADGDSTSYKITIDGIDYSNATADVSDMAELKTHLLAATADDGTAVSDLFTITNSPTGATGSLIFQYIDEGAKGVTDFTLATVVSDDATSFQASTSVTVNQAGASQASDAITAIDAALATVASERASLGATQAQLESTVRNLANVAENTSAAAGRIMDTDYAAETANLTKAQILQQAATSVLAQANAQPQSVLSLLQ
ncbi:flagellin [Luminiphilus sp.]|nr:flagellin [Luminiphilus sp.]